MKIAFVTDTGTGQHPDYWEEKGIYCLPLQITCDGESKDEYTEITYSEVIQKLHEKKVLKTSLPSLGKIQDCFEKLKHEIEENRSQYDELKIYYGKKDNCTLDGLEEYLLNEE